MKKNSQNPFIVLTLAITLAITMLSGCANTDENTAIVLDKMTAYLKENHSGVVFDKRSEVEYKGPVSIDFLKVDYHDRLWYCSFKGKRSNKEYTIELEYNSDKDTMTETDYYIDYIDAEIESSDEYREINQKYFDQLYEHTVGILDSAFPAIGSTTYSDYINEIDDKYYESLSDYLFLFDDYIDDVRIVDVSKIDSLEDSFAKILDIAKEIDENRGFSMAFLNFYFPPGYSYKSVIDAFHTAFHFNDLNIYFVEVDAYGDSMIEGLPYGSDIIDDCRDVLENGGFLLRFDLTSYKYDHLSHFYIKANKETISRIKGDSK